MPIVKVNNRKSLAALLGASAAAALIAFVPSKEGTVYKTYKDLGGVLTYCTGATEDAQWGKSYTPAECKAQLDKDLERHAEGMLACVHVPLTNGQKVAYTDFTYNAGVYAFCRSTVARKANEGDVKGSCDALLAWDKVGSKVVKGLQIRRQQEREFCLKGSL